MPDKLSTYHAKRNFGITPEPEGEQAMPSERLRFVVQKHHARRLHYDFRLELDGTLKSWAVPKGPSLDPSEKRLAVHVEDHPLDYIDFEGDIPEHQYGAGHVEVWDSGYWEAQGNPMHGYRSGKLKFRLDGDKLHGGWTLVRTRLQASGNKEQWLLIKEHDEAARNADERDITAEQMKDSDATAGGTDTPSHEALASAVRKPLPETLRPQLASLADAVPQHGDWMYEIKFDGYRILARADNGDVTLLTREGKDWTAKLRRQAEAVAGLDLASAWLDGEIVVLDADGMPSFQLLQNAFDRDSTAQIIYFVFDLPYLNDHDLRAVPLAQRRMLLQRVLDAGRDEHLRYSAPIEQPVQQLLDSACRLALEGIIGKRSDSVYISGRSTDWIKLKCRQRQEFVIAGHTAPQGSRKFFGALLLAVYGDDGKLRYAGRVGTGFDRATLNTVHKKMTALEQDACPFERMPSGLGRSSPRWLKPQLVAEISFAEWTHDGALRQAVFHGLRADKPAEQVRREDAAEIPADGNKNSDSSNSNGSKRGSKAAGDLVQGVAVTHPERMIDSASGMTKRDLVQYYEWVAPHILPYLKNRPVYLLRAPEGVSGEQFFQKHANRTTIPGIRTFDQALDPGHAPLMAIESAQALVGAAQMGNIELHTCNATADRIERPDYMVFDLDPDPELSWSKVIEGARLTKVVLDELGLKSFLKTSGGKGLHLLVPLARRHAWDQVAAFSHAIARHLARTLPQHFSAKMGEKNRVGKIFVDYLRNRRQASTVAPYSVRARPDLPVAAPIGWDELTHTTGSVMWTVASLPQHLAQRGSDPWKDFFSTRQILTVAMQRAIGMTQK